MRVGSWNGSALRSTSSARRRGRALRALASLFAIGALQCANVTTSPAENARSDSQSAGADLAHAPDFRVRVSAALLIGRTRPEGARQMLEHALTDAHPAVRTAAAAALIAVGDASAIPALERAMRNEASGSARAQMQTSITSLRGGAAPASNPHARYVVQLGSMKNGPNVAGDLGSVLRRHARAQASSLPGAFVLDPQDPHAPRAADVTGHMPVLLFDGTVTRLAQTAGSGSTRIEAQVEFAVRRIPQQTLQGTLSGSATTIESTRGGINASRLAELQSQAIGSAVESALRGADRVALAAK